MIVNPDCDWFKNEKSLFRLRTLHDFCLWSQKTNTVNSLLSGRPRDIEEVFALPRCPLYRNLPSLSAEELKYKKRSPLVNKDVTQQIYCLYKSICSRK